MPCRTAFMLIMTAVAGAAGCGPLLTTKVPKYLTVEASPHRDTSTAERENAKAVKILDRYEAGGHGSLRKAGEHLEKALVADVRFGPAHNNLGKVHLLEQKYYLAAWEFEYAIKLMPARPEPHHNLGTVYEAVGKLDLASEQYETAFGLDARNPYVIGNLARARLRLGDPPDEVRPFLEMLLLYDTRPEWTSWARELLAREDANGQRNVPPAPATQNAPEELPPPQPESLPPFGPAADEGMLPPLPGERPALPRLEFPKSMFSNKSAHEERK